MAVNQTQIDLLQKFLRHDARPRAERLLGRFRPEEIADIFARLRPSEQRKLADLLLDKGDAAETFTELPEYILTDLLGRLENADVACLLGNLAPDDAVAMLNKLPEQRQQQVMEELDNRERERIEYLQLYPDESAGSIMTSEMVLLEEGMTAQEAIESAREHGKETEFIFYLYVVNEAGVFLGVVPIRRLIAAPKERLVDEIMVPDPIAVYATDDQEEVAAVTARYDLLAVPVVDDNFRLVGVITGDDLLDVVQEEATEDMYLMQGLAEEDRVHSPVRTSVRKRFPWMVLNLGTAFLASWVVGLFEESIGEVVALATFMPIVAGVAGNGGTQTLTVITRGMAIGELEFSEGLWAAFKQFGIGLLVGAGVGLLSGTVAWLWKANVFLGGILFASMVVNLAVAGLVGAAFPLILKALGKDPALGSGVLVTTFTDITGFWVFLGLGTMFLQYL